MQSISKSLWRVIRIDESFYSDVLTDESYNNQSFLVVLISSLALGMTPLVYGSISAAIMLTVINFMFWYGIVLFIYLIGNKVFKEKGVTPIPYSAFIRVMGFAAAPGILRVLGIFPVLAPFVIPLAHIWMLVSLILGAKIVLQYKSMLKTIGVCFFTLMIPSLLSVILKMVAIMLSGTSQP